MIRATLDRVQFNAWQAQQNKNVRGHSPASRLLGIIFVEKRKVVRASGAVCDGTATQNRLIGVAAAAVVDASLPL